jgi:hypothetical protein
LVFYLRESPSDVPVYTSAFPSSERPTRFPTSQRGRGDLDLLRMDRGVLVAIESATAIPRHREPTVL